MFVSARTAHGGKRPAEAGAGRPNNEPFKQGGASIMTVLVAVASKHGSTHDIAGAIAGELRSAGLGVDLHDMEEVTDLAGYSAAVLGSAIYMGNWLGEARRFVEQHAAELAALPVWLFSSGPLGEDDPTPHGEPEGVPPLVAATHARDHRVFVGKLDPHELGLGEKLIAKAVHAPAGDFRDWDAIRAWAREIAAALAAAPA
jgi:menaquinone-dependent protoporphyrinogen oxidase